MSAYSFTAAEKLIVDAAKGDVVALEAAYKSGALSMAAIIAATAAAAAPAPPKDALTMVKLADGGHVTFKIGDKGGISAYGVGGKFPVTLYAAGWLRLIEALAKAELPALIEANKDKLAWKVKEDSKA